MMISFFLPTIVKKPSAEKKLVYKRKKRDMERQKILYSYGVCAVVKVGCEY
jgi:hypothetical protein